jgi:hypothetical protein
MFCSHCGTKLLDTRGTCQVCGYQTPELPSEVRDPADGLPSAGSCPGCGALLAGDEAFCGDCGMCLLPLPVGFLEDYVVSANAPLVGEVGYEVSLLTGQDKVAHEEVLPGDQVVAESSSRAVISRLGVPITSGDKIPRLGKSWAELVSSPDETGDSARAFVRTRMALVISLLCFTASLVSAAAAIWLAASN